MNLITKSILFFAFVFFYQVKLNAQETIKQEATRVADLHGRNDSISTTIQEPVKPQEPAKKDAAKKEEAGEAVKESNQSNKMAINEQGINKTKPKKKSTQKKDTTTEKKPR